MIPGASLLYVPVMVGAISGIYGPLFTTSLIESMEPGMRPRGIASYSFVNTLPAIISPYLGGLMILYFGNLEGIRYSFLIAGTFGVLAISYRALKLNESHIRPERVGLVQFWKSLFHETKHALATVGRDAKLLLAYSTAAAFAVGLTSSFSVLYFVQALHFKPYIYGIMVGISAFVIILLLFPAAKMAERFGLKKSVILSSLSVPVNQLFFTKAKDMDELVTWSVVGGTGNALLGPPLTSLQSDLVPRFMRGRIMSMFSALPLLFSIPSQIIGGYLYSIQPLLPFVVSIPVFFVAVLILLRIREPKRLEN